MRYQHLALWAALMGSVAGTGCSAVIDTSDYAFCEEGDERCEMGLAPVAETCQEFTEPLEGQWSSGCILMQTADASSVDEAFPEEIVYTFEVDGDCEGKVTVDHIVYLSNEDAKCEVALWVEQQVHEFAVDVDALDVVPVLARLTVEDFRVAVVNEEAVQLANDPDEPFIEMTDWELSKWRTLLDVTFDSPDLSNAQESVVYTRDRPMFLKLQELADGTYRFSPPWINQRRGLWDYVFTLSSKPSVEDRFF